MGNALVVFRVALNEVTVGIVSDTWTVYSSFQRISVRDGYVICRGEMGVLQTCFVDDIEDWRNDTLRTFEKVLV